MENKWDYQLMMFANDRDMRSVQEALIVMGEQGWELISVYPNPAGSTYMIYAFKKPK